MEQLWWDASLWIALALISSLISLRIGISVALVELIVGIIAGNTFRPQISQWINFLASFGAVVLTFLTALALFLLPKITPYYLKRVNAHSSEPEVKYIFLVLLVLAYLAVRGGSEGVLPAYLVGMVLADTFLGNKELIRRMRATTFALLTPFYFLKAGSLVDLTAVLGSLGLVALFFLSKTLAKFFGLYPAGVAFRFTRRVNGYMNLMMSTGLTFGTISALYGLTHGIIDKERYSILVVTVILTAIIPTLIAPAFFEPKGREREILFEAKGGQKDV